MQTTQTKSVEVISLLTTNVLIPMFEQDGKQTWELNVYGTMAKFVATATIINQESKQCQRIKFESDLFCLDDPKKNIHEDWKKFHQNVLERANILTDYQDPMVAIKIK